MVDFKLRYLIDADGRKAKAELNDVDRHINKMGAGITGSLGGAAGILGTAAAGLSAVVVGGVAVTKQLFDMSKAASEFGSKIFDASEKTGLHAETLSSMKFAADQSGSSLENVTSAIAKFSKNVGAAVDGSKEAAASMKALGIDPQAALKDLDGSLAKVFDRIAKAKPGIEQITLAQKAFGKSGADLLPFIKSFDGDLAGLVKRAKELGVTIDDEAARAADEFGDQLDTLGAQFEGITRTIGTAFMPVFMDMAKETSDWAVRNKDEIADWATGAASSVQAIINKIRDLIEVSNEYKLVGKGVWDIIFAYPAAFDKLSGISAERARINADKAMRPDVGIPYGPGGVRTRADGSVTVPGTGTTRRPPAESDREFRKFFEEMGFNVNRTYGGAVNKGSLHPSGLAADIKTNGEKIADIFALTAKALEKGYRLVDERVKQPGVKSKGPHQHYERGGRLRASMFGTPDLYGGQQQLDYLKNLDAERLGKASGMSAYSDYQKKLAADAERFREEEMRDAESFLQEWLSAERQASEQRLDIRKTEADLAVEIIGQMVDQGIMTEVEATQRLGELKIDMLEEERREIGQRISTTENILRLEQIGIELQKQRIKNERDVTEAVRQQNEEFWEQLRIKDRMLQKANQRPGTMKHRGQQPKGFMDTLFGGDISLELDKFTSTADYMAKTMSDLGQMTNDAFGQMAAGLGSLVEQWVLTGTLGPDALKKMTASVLANLAAQSATYAIFELAKGFAALFWNPAEAAAHFTSAALFGSIAVGAGLAGRAIAGDSFTKDSRGGSGSGSGSGSRRDEDLTPISRVSDDAYVSGRPQSKLGSEADQLLIRVIDRLNQKLEATRPGDVFVAGMKQNRGAVGRQVVEDIKSNSSIGVAFSKANGGR
jgi:hypothetical protein